MSPAPPQQPACHLRIAFATRSVPMHGRTPWERDLGGSESALIFAARGLAALGHEVEVFTRCDAPGEYDGVTYHDIADLGRQAALRDWDAFISLRFPDLVLSDVRAGVRVLWCQDVLDGAPIETWLPWIDRLVFVSEWHRDRTVARVPLAGRMAAVVPNPVVLSMIPDRCEEDGPLLVHLSRPERGLEALLTAWPSIRARVPGARLGIARYRSFHEPRGSQIEAFCVHMDHRVEESPGAFRLGHLSKPELYGLLSRAALMVYPAEFDETSCIAAIEAQACGCPVVAVRRGALPETLAPGACVLVEPGPEMRARFADRVVELLFDPERRAAMSAAGKERAEAHDVARIAEAWEKVLLDALDRPAASPLRPSGSAARWPGIGPTLHTAIQARLGTDRVLTMDAALDDSSQGSFEAVLDLGLPSAADPVAWLAEVARRAGAGTRVLSVVPWAAGVACAAEADPDAIGAWFEGATQHGLTLEASIEWGEPARCWLVSWVAGELKPEPAPATRRRRRATVSACLIVRDSADTLLTCLSSIAPIVDEIRVMDTGSRDATMSIVREFAARSSVPVRLWEETWPDDFAVARNRSVDGAEGDWILWIDADERLVGGERIRRLVQTDLFEAYAVRQHNHIFDRGATQIEIPFRLYRNGKGYRFFGAVHEHPERALNELIEPWTLAEGVEILHGGYLTEAGRVKKLLGRNLRLLNLDRERYPGRLLTDILYLRDAVNLAWFDQRDHGAIRADHLAALRAALDRYEQVHMPERGRYYQIGRKHYDQGLGLLGEGVELRVKVGGPDAQDQTFRVRRSDDATWLAATPAREHLLSFGRSA